jgi:homoserine O-acetyltransferase
MTASAAELQKLAPTREAADALYRRLVERASASDAYDRLYQLGASMDYDPTTLLGRIEARVLAIISPTTRSTGALQAGIAQVKNARRAAASGRRRSTLLDAFWKAELQSLLGELA